MDETQQREPTRYREDRFEDEIELMDCLRVVWRWKYLIVLGTLICAVATGVISFSAPKIYRFDMVIEPGILTVDRGGRNVYIDSPENIKAIIEAGTFNKEILSKLGESNNNRAQSLKFKVNIPRKASLVKVSYDTSDVERGSQILNQLAEVLLKKYAGRVAYFQNQYETQIGLKKGEMDQLGVEKQASEWRIRNLQKRIDQLKSASESIRKNMQSLVQKRDKFLSKDTDGIDTASAVLYTTVMQENIALQNSYRLEVNDYVSQQQEEKLSIKDLSIRERVLLEEIENIASSRDNVQNMQILQAPTRSPNPVKPKIKLNVILAFVGGLFLMVFLAFFLEYIQRHRGEHDL
jgi:capsular polysaccharide biosynthesis protein